jgi:hypothetical protein
MVLIIKQNIFYIKSGRLQIMNIWVFFRQNRNRRFILNLYTMFFFHGLMKSTGFFFSVLISKYKLVPKSNKHAAYYQDSPDQICLEWEN